MSEPVCKGGRQTRVQDLLRGLFDVIRYFAYALLFHGAENGPKRQRVAVHRAENAVEHDLGSDLGERNGARAARTTDRCSFLPWPFVFIRWRGESRILSWQKESL